MTYKGETLFELDEDGYYILSYIMLYYIILYYIILNNHKLIITGHAFSNNYLEYESSDALSVKEYLDNIKPY